MTDSLDKQLFELLSQDTGQSSEADEAKKQQVHPGPQMLWAGAIFTSTYLGCC